MTPEQALYFYEELLERLLDEMDGMFSPEWTEQWLKDAGYSKEEVEYLGYFEDEDEED